jgi:hypothetical protein
MSDKHSFSVQSWSEIYQLLRGRAEASRGTITLTTNGARNPIVPRTTAGDAYAIALVFDAAVNEHAPGHLVQRWIWESDLLAGEPEANAAETYVGNRSLWETLSVAASELDRVKAPLPPTKPIDDAMRVLASERPSTAQGPRHAGSEVLVTVFAERTWRAMSERQLEFFRVLRGESRTDSPFVPDVPCTCNADVLALARYWSDQLESIGRSASDTYNRLVYSCWREVLLRVRQVATGAPTQEIYAHNSEFWSALLLLTTQSDACDESPAPWAFNAPGWYRLARNSAVVDTGPSLDFPAAKSWDEAAQMQRDAFSKLRGEDLVSGLISRIPRTTIADVRQLGAYWIAGLAKAGEHHDADVSYRHVIERWKAATAEVARIPRDADPESVYAHNTEFWTALMTIAIQIAVTAEAPTRWTLAKQAIAHGIANLPQTLSSAIQDVIDAGGQVLGGVLKKPMLYAGVGLGGILLLVYFARRAAEPPRTAGRP